MKNLHQAAKASASLSMKNAAEVVFTQQVAAGEESPAEIAVTTDGTWMRRGYSSLYGMQTVIAWETQQFVDVEVLTRYCTFCTRKETPCGTILEILSACRLRHSDGPCYLGIYLPQRTVQGCREMQSVLPGRTRGAGGSNRSVDMAMFLWQFLHRRTTLSLLQSLKKLNLYMSILPTNPSYRAVFVVPHRMPMKHSMVLFDISVQRNRSVAP